MTFWHKAPNDSGAALILTLGWSAVLLALAGVVSSAVLQQVRPSDNAESSYQAWAAAEAGVDDARARLSANSEYWKSIAAFNADPNADSAVAKRNPALVRWVDVPGSQEGGPEFTYYMDVSGAAEYGRIRITSSGRAREGDDTVRTVDVLVTKRLSTDYAYLSNSESFPHDLPGAYGQANDKDGASVMSPAVARELCSTGGGGEEQTYWYQWKPWPGNDAGGPRTAADSDDPNLITYGGSHRNSYACLHSVVTTDNGNVTSNSDQKGVVFDGPAHTNDVWYIDERDVGATEDADRIGTVFGGEVTSSCPDSVCDPEVRWLGSSLFPQSGEVGGGGDPGKFVPNELVVGENYKNRSWNPAYSPVLEMPSDQQLRELRTIAASGGCVFSGPTRIRMTTDQDGRGKVHITSPDTITDTSTNTFCGQGYATDSSTLHPTVTLDYAEMVAAGFNGVFYVEESTEADPPTCWVKDGQLRLKNSNYPWVIPSAEQEPDDLPITGTFGGQTGDSVKGLPDQSTVFQVQGLNLGNDLAGAYENFDALSGAQEAPEIGDAFYVKRQDGVGDENKVVVDGDQEYLVYRYTKKGNSGEWEIADVSLFYDEWTHFPEEQCRNGHVYLEAPAEDGGYTGRYTIAADGDIVITDDIYEKTATARDDAASDDWGVPDAASDNQLGLVPDRWLYIYKLDQAKGGDQGAIRATMKDLLLNIAVLAKDKCLALQDYSATPALDDIKIVGALAQNSRCRLTDKSSGYNGVVAIDYDDRYKRLGPPPFMPVLSQEPWQAKVWSETTVRRDFEAKENVKALTTANVTSTDGITLTWSLSEIPDAIPDDGELLYVRLLTGAGGVTADTSAGTVSYTRPGGFDEAVIEFVVKTSDGLTVGQTITDTSTISTSA